MSRRVILLGLSLGFIFFILVGSLSITALTFPSGFVSEKSIQGDSSSIKTISTNGNGPTVLGFGPRIVTISASDIYMDAGGTHAVLSGTVSSLNGFPSATVWFEWGYDTAYGTVVGSTVVAATGQVNADIFHFNPDKEVHYRFNGNIDGTVYGNDQVISKISGGGVPTVYRLSNILPFIFLGITILMIIGLIYAGVPLVLVIIMAGILALIGVVGASSILEILRSLW